MTDLLLYLEMYLQVANICQSINFRFSPCIFKVNHFYWPTNALNCI